MAEIRCAQIPRSVAFSSRFTYGPAPLGAAPAIRASERNVLDVPATTLALPTASKLRTAGLRVARM